MQLRLSLFPRYPGACLSKYLQLLNNLLLGIGNTFCAPLIIEETRPKSLLLSIKSHEFYLCFPIFFLSTC